MSRHRGAAAVRAARMRRRGATVALSALLCLFRAQHVLAQAVAISVQVADAAPLQTLDDKYLGFNIDSGSLYHNIQLGDAIFRQLAKNLVPGQLRVGGSASDSLWFVPTAPDGATQGPSPDPLAPNAAAAAAPGFSGYTPEVTIMNSDMWRSLTQFATGAQLDLLFDVNAVDFRTPSGAWNPAGNATGLLEATAAENLYVAAWELGNEPDLWGKHFGMNVGGAQLADDLRALQALAASHPGMSTAVSGPSLATFNATLVASFLQQWGATGGGALSFTAHAYPLGPPTYAPASSRPSCSVANYLNLTRVSNVSSYLGQFSAAVAQYGSTTATRMVLEETASNSLGGCIGYSDRFISGFYFTNLLGVVGESGWQQINRQDLAGMSFTANGSQYTLFGPPGWSNGSGLVSATSPHADYYTAVLWKRLMGRGVMTNTVTGDWASSFVAHVWCAADTAPGAKAGAVTLAYVNAYTVSVTVTLTGADGDALPLTPRSEFFLTNPNLTDYSAYLNVGADADKLQRAMARLHVRSDGTLPKELRRPKGRFVKHSKALVLPPLSYGYVVLPNAGSPACRGANSPAPLLRVPHWVRHLAIVVTITAATSVVLLAVIWRKTRGNAWGRDEALLRDERLLTRSAQPTQRYGALL